MKKRKIILTGLLTVLFSVLVTAQTKKTIVEKNVQSITVHEYFLDEHKDKPVIERFEAFNDSGELIEIKEFNSRGDVKLWEKYSFNDNGELIEEQFLTERGKIDKTEKTFYKDGLRVEKQFFDSRGRLYKKKVYIYEYHK